MRRKVPVPYLASIRLPTAAKSFQRKESNGDRGAQALGGMAINRRKIVDESKDFVDRVLGALDAESGTIA